MSTPTKPIFLPLLGATKIINDAIAQGRGAAAAVLGQSFDVRRLDGTTNSSVSSNDPVLTGLPARIRRTTSKVMVENATFDLLVYNATVDERQLQLQDLLTETGPAPYTDGGHFYFVQHRVTRETLWIRAESNCTITRPWPPSGRMDQQPNAGAREVKGWGGPTKSGEQVLTLTNGMYAFGNADDAMPATVYCGLQPMNKIGDTSKSSAAGQIPTALYRERFCIYVPDLPGVVLNELDRINGPNNDRFEVMLYHNTDEIGLTGYVAICEKLSV